MSACNDGSGAATPSLMVFVRDATARAGLL